MKSEPRQSFGGMAVEKRDSAETPVWKIPPTRNAVRAIATRHADPVEDQYADIEDVVILGEN